MIDLQLSQNIVRLRREKNVTQEALAAHIGVTKGAVSKWENGSTLPDLATLPLLAAYFDVSVDALLGYTPQLTREQIKEHYQDFARDFSERPFEEVFAEVQALVKEYYACYPLLYQMGVLLLNHFMLAATPDAQQAVLGYMDTLLERVQSESDDSALAADARVLQAIVWLQQGRSEEVVAVLETLADPTRLTDNVSAVLISAYLMRGDLDKANAQAQLAMYLSLLALVNHSMRFLMIHAQDEAAFRETVARIDAVVAAYDLVHLHPNSVLQFRYQAAVVALQQGNAAEALRQLEQFVAAIAVLFEPDGFRLHGDAYFTGLDGWVAQLELGESAPRDREMVRQDLLANFDLPFAALAEDADFRRILTKLKAVMA